jgi:hypothetical protein
MADQPAAGIRALVTGFELLRSDPEEAGRRADAARDAVHHVERDYREAMAELLEVDDVRVVFAGRFCTGAISTSLTRSSPWPTDCGSSFCVVHDSPASTPLTGRSAPCADPPVSSIDRARSRRLMSRAIGGLSWCG